MVILISPLCQYCTLNAKYGFQTPTELNVTPRCIALLSARDILYAKIYINVHALGTFQCQLLLSVNHNLTRIHLLFTIISHLRNNRTSYRMNGWLIVLDILLTFSVFHQVTEVDILVANLIITCLPIDTLLVTATIVNFAFINVSAFKSCAAHHFQS